MRPRLLATGIWATGSLRVFGAAFRPTGPSLDRVRHPYASTSISVKVPRRALAIAVGCAAMSSPEQHQSPSENRPTSANKRKNRKSSGGSVAAGGGGTRASTRADRGGARGRRGSGGRGRPGGSSKGYGGVGGGGGRRRSRSPQSSRRTFAFDLHPSRLHFVDTVEGLEAAGEILSRAVLLGIDTETNPSFAIGEWHPTSLLQMGTRDARGEEDVILLDLLALQDGLRLPPAVANVLHGPFGSASVFKLGVGLAPDLEELAFSYDGTPFLKSVPGILSLADLHQQLGEFPQRNETSLRKLTNFHLGVSLSKSSQMSSWGDRPLRLAQLKYAACDALVALRLYDAILSRCGHVDANQLCETWTPKDLPLSYKRHLKALQVVMVQLERYIGLNRPHGWLKFSESCAMDLAQPPGMDDDQVRGSGIRFEKAQRKLQSRANVLRNVQSYRLHTGSIPTTRDTLRSWQSELSSTSPPRKGRKSNDDAGQVEGPTPRARKKMGHARYRSSSAESASL